MAKVMRAWGGSGFWLVVGVTGWMVDFMVS